MIQLNDIGQSEVDASKIVDVKMREILPVTINKNKCKIAIDCILDGEILLSFYYSDKAIGYADYQKLFIATNS